MASDIADAIASYAKCQKRKGGPRPNIPLLSLLKPGMWHTIGIDFYGPLLMTRTKKQFILVAIDHFSKWVVLEALAHATAEEVVRFIYDRLVC